MLKKHNYAQSGNPVANLVISGLSKFKLFSLFFQIDSLKLVFISSNKLKHSNPPPL